MQNKHKKILDKGFPKGGGGGGGVRRFGKNSQIISFFLFESVPKLTGLDGLNGLQNEPVLLALLCGANKNLVIGPISGSKQEYFSSSLLYCQQIRINISHPNPPPAEVHSEISNSIHPHSLTCLNQGPSPKSPVTY